MKTVLTSCIATSALLATACSSTPTSTLSGDSGDSVYTETVTDFTVNEIAWIGLPVFTVKGKASLRVVSVRFAHYPEAGLSTPQFYRVPFTPTDNGSITLYNDLYFRKFGHKTSGPYLGTILRPGDPTGYGVAKLVVQARGTYHVSDVIIRYAEPDGSTRSQTFHVNYVLGTNGGR